MTDYSEEDSFVQRLEAEIAAALSPPKRTVMAAVEEEDTWRASRGSEGSEDPWRTSGLLGKKEPSHSVSRNALDGDEEEDSLADLPAVEEETEEDPWRTSGLVVRGGGGGGKGKSKGNGKDSLSWEDEPPAPPTTKGKKVPVIPKLDVNSVFEEPRER